MQLHVGSHLYKNCVLFVVGMWVRIFRDVVVIDAYEGNVEGTLVWILVLEKYKVGM